MEFDVMEILSWKIPYIDMTVQNFIVGILITLVAYIVLLKVALPYVKRVLKKARLPELMVDLMARMVRVLMIVIVLIVFLGAIGIEVGSLVLALSAVMGLILAFGMADSFNNLFAGTWIAMLRPIDKDEVVEVNGKTGKVSAVGIMATELLKPDNTFITIPNKLVWGSPVVNYTRMPTRRVDVDVGIEYGADVGKAYEVGMKVIKSHPKVREDPEPFIYMTELADSSVNLQLRAWVKTEDYWDVLHDLRKAILDALPEAGIGIPFPQLDLHVKREDLASLAPM